MRDHVIWSDEHQLFWRPDSAGYTRSFKEAGLYSHDEVEQIIRHAGPEKRIVGLLVGINYLGRKSGLVTPDA